MKEIRVLYITIVFRFVFLCVFFLPFFLACEEMRLLILLVFMVNKLSFV